ncbi:MAG: hypothetical protein KAT34_05390 [Candidatus Aminicenantes bacterium]|nr:hypothetical protein [Candidatus Aminicenantes bacterium]
MDVFGTRIFKNKEQKERHQKRIEEIKSSKELIPTPVETAYVPSGETEPGAISKFFLGGLGGSLLGAIVAVIAFYLAVGVFKIFEEVGRCLIWLYYPAVLVYYFSPVLISIFAGIITGNMGKWSRSRRPSQAGWIAFFWGLIAAGATFFYIEDYIIEAAFDHWEVRDCLFGEALSPELMEGTAGWIVKGLIVALDLILAPLLAASEIGIQKFCEHCKNYLSESIIARISIANISDLILGSLVGDKELFDKLELLPEKEKWTNKDERLDLIHASCPCENTHFIEVMCYWVKKKGKKKEQASEENRLIYSEEFTAMQISTLKSLLPKRT